MPNGTLAEGPRRPTEWNKSPGVLIMKQDRPWFQGVGSVRAMAEDTAGDVRDGHREDHLADSCRTPTMRHPTMTRTGPAGRDRAARRQTIGRDALRRPALPVTDATDGRRPGGTPPPGAFPGRERSGGSFTTPWTKPHPAGRAAPGGRCTPWRSNRSPSWTT